MVNQIINGDALEVLQTLPDSSINCCITSPPYFGLRDYGVDGQVGNESTPEEYVQKLTEILTEVKRVLKDDGTLWLNLGDSYAGSNQGAGTKNPTAKQKSNRGTNYMTTVEHKSKLAKLPGLKAKDLIGIPWMVAFALRDDGWYLRQDIIWYKPNCMPESVKDRCTKSHEYIFMFSKSKKYYFDNEAIREPCVTNDTSSPRGSKGALTPNSGRRKQNQSCAVQGAEPNERCKQQKPPLLRNKRDVWSVSTKPCREAHFATFPDTLIEPCVLAGCPKGGIILDPFLGSGTTAFVAARNKRNYIGIELNPEYIEIAQQRISQHCEQ